MGIPGFNSWFSRNHQRAFVPLTNVRLDHIYIDMNSVLHLVLRRARNMDHFHMLMYAKLDGILRVTQPRKSVLFALDGPAPLAKLLTQRARRKKVQMTPAQQKGKVVPSIAITPGTPFMQDVHESLAYYICHRLIGSKFSHLQMELSGSTVQGEGEVKILSRLQRPLDNVKHHDTHAMIGNDSDLIIMALLSETPHLHVLSQVLASDQTPPAERMNIFSVDALHEVWRDVGPPAEVNERLEFDRIRGLRQDLAVNCILSRGNDYLPSVSGVTSQNVGDDSLWRTYLRLRRTDKRFRYRTLAKQLPDGTATLDEEFIGTVLRDCARAVYQSRPAAYIKGPDPARYLEGLCWVLEMYHGGVCPDYRFVYDGLGPVAGQVCEVIDERQKQGIKRVRATAQSSQKNAEKSAEKSAEKVAEKQPQPIVRVVEVSEPGQKTSEPPQRHPNKRHRGGPNGRIVDPALLPLKPMECAMALLPKSGQMVAPKALQHLMEKDSPIQDIYHECPDCEQFSGRSSEIQTSITNLSRKRMQLQEDITMLAGAPTIPKLEEELAKVNEELSSWKDQARSVQEEREKHMIEMHPYKPFPIGRLEEAISAVPIESYTEKERELTRFGKNYIFKRLDWRQKQVSGRGVSFKKMIGQKVKTPPEPPCPKFRTLKGPLPILRYLQAAEYPGRALAQTARNIVKFAKGKL